MTADSVFVPHATEPNAEVGAIHPKAMPVILTTAEEREFGSARHGRRPKRSSGPCRRLTGRGRTGGQSRTLQWCSPRRECGTLETPGGLSGHVPLFAALRLGRFRRALPLPSP